MQSLSRVNKMLALVTPSENDLLFLNGTRVEKEVPQLGLILDKTKTSVEHTPQKEIQEQKRQDVAFIKR